MTTLDASPITTLPSGIPALPTGTFLLPITTPSIAPDSCLENPAQSGAWSCAIPSGLPYQMTVSGIPGSSSLSNNEITLDLGNSTLGYLPYGAQPPVLNQAQVLSLARNVPDPERGPAWFFQTLYNKVVILPEGALTPLNTKRATNSHGDDTVLDFVRKGVTQPGDRPWFCYWNGTLLEAFLYVNETSRAGARSSAHPTGAATATYSSATSSPTSTVPSPGQTVDPAFLPCYPKTVKLEERRLPLGSQPITPYCVQQYIAGDGSPHPYTNGTGEPIIIYLNETEPTVTSPMLARAAIFGGLEEEEGGAPSERRSVSTCGCVWLDQ
jgi:hypothetical protein